MMLNKPIRRKQRPGRARGPNTEGQWAHVAEADLMLGDCGYRNLDIVTDATEEGCMPIWSKEMLYLGMVVITSALQG